MQQSKSLTFSAYESVAPSVNGFQFHVNGLEFIFNQCFILSASVTIHYADPSQPATIQIPEEAQPSLSIQSHVSHFGITGHSLSNFRFLLSWEHQNQKVLITGITLANSSLNVFFDALPKTYATFGSLLEKVDMAELAQIAKAPSLPILKDWNLMPNYSYPTFSEAPNPLNAKEASIDENLPHTITMLAYNTSDFKYYLTCKVTYHKGWVTAVTIEFYSFPDYGKKGARASLLKTYDVTSSIGNTLSFYYTTYWLSSHKVPLGTALNLFMGGPVMPYNSMVQGGPGPVSITFNFKEPELYSDGMLFPLTGNMVAMPVKN